MLREIRIQEVLETVEHLGAQSIHGFRIERWKGERYGMGIS